MWQVESARAKKKPYPTWLADRPDVEGVEEWYLEAFWNLSSCRSHTDYGVGPVPWRDIVRYAEVYDLPMDLMLGFTQVIRALDAVYLKHQQAELEKRRKKPAKDE